MQVAYEPRASAVLFNILVNQAGHLPFLLPANICPIVPITFFKAGTPFEFVDISPATLHMNMDTTLERLSENPQGYGGVLYAHTYGEASTPQAFFKEIKRKHPDLLVIDDCCLCVPVTEPESISEADVVLYSTGYSKFVDLGLGGYSYMRPEVAYRPRHLPFRREDLIMLELAYKGNIASRQPFTYHDSDWLQTGCNSSNMESYFQDIMKVITTSLAHRRRINDIYITRLPVKIQLPEHYQFWRFNLRVENKQKILDALFAAGLFASSHYASLAGIMAPGSCSEAEKLANHIVNLFNDSHATEEMAEKTCQVILKNI